MKMHLHLRIARWAAICVCIVAVPLALFMQFQGDKIQPWIAALLFANLGWTWMLLGNKEKE